MPTAVVTGASGYIGRQLCRRLVKDGWTVHAPVRMCDLRAYEPEVIVTPRSAAGLVDWFDEIKPNAVFHLAGRFVGDHVGQQIADLLDANVVFGTYVLEAAAKCKSSVLVSAGSAWQRARAGGPANLYGATKQAFAAIAEHYAYNEGLNVVILRLQDVYGPNDPRVWRLVPQLCWAANIEGYALDMSSGEQVVDLVYIDDVCDEFLRAAKTGAQHKGGLYSYGVGSGDRNTLQKVVVMFEDVIGKKLKVNWGARPHRKCDVIWPCDAVLYDQSRVRLRDGLRRVYLASRENPA